MTFFKAGISALNLSENAEGKKSLLALDLKKKETLRGTKTQVSDGNQCFFINGKRKSTLYIC